MKAHIAYGYGRQASHRGGEIKCPFENGSEEAKNFWDGVRDVRGEDALNIDDEWDS
jgi:hypothetical protein